MLGNKNLRVVVAGAIAAVSLGGCRGSADEVVVLAAASLRDAFADMSAAYEAAHPARRVAMDLGPSSLLAARLMEGVSADVFAAADEAQMARFLVADGAPRRGPEIFATNRLAVVTPASNPADIEIFDDLARPGVSVVLAGADVPAGAYARRFLASHSLLDRVLGNVVSYGSDVKDVLTKVRLGEADAGIVYATDVTVQVAQDVRMIELPSEPSARARYPIVAVSESPEAADFVRFVLSDEGRAILAAHGFGVP